MFRREPNGVLERVESHVEIVVADSGEGMDADFVPHGFDRFRQADASTTRAQSGFGLGLAYRPTPHLELAANYASELDVHASGTAKSQLGPSAGAPPLQVDIVPVTDDKARCAKGGTPDALKACVDLALPRNLQVGGRYIFLDEAGAPKGDIELDLDWENWGKSCSASDFNDGSCVSASDYRVTVSRRIPLN